LVKVSLALAISLLVMFSVLRYLSEFLDEPDRERVKTASRIIVRTVLVGIVVPSYFLIYFKLKKNLMQRAEMLASSLREAEIANIKQKMAIVFLYFAAICQFCVTRVVQSSILILYPETEFNPNFIIT